MTKGIFLILAFIAFFVLITGFVLAAVPSGANYTGEVTTTAAADDPELHTAYAGNLTYLDVYGTSTSQSWQGYYGNVSGTIQLANSGDKVLYNWSLTSPSGEVYASENGTAIAWANITCYNFTANYSEGGQRLTKLETRFNLSSDDGDGVNETFKDDNTHAAFNTASTAFTAGQCPATYMYANTGEGSSGTFEEVLLTDASDDVQVVFASLLEETNTVGFDGNYYDFEMIVLEKGKSGDTNPRNYYFYVELE
jgi:hypothetical protein